MNETDPFLPDNDDGVPPYLENKPKLPLWLILTYIIVPIWGAACLYFFWNGSTGWLDRGYWKELQQAANTRYPYGSEADKTAK